MIKIYNELMDDEQPTMLQCIEKIHSIEQAEAELVQEGTGSPVHLLLNGEHHASGAVGDVAPAINPDIFGMLPYLRGSPKHAEQVRVGKLFV